LFAGAHLVIAAIGPVAPKLRVSNTDHLRLEHRYY
jgi:hypothetical protein